jgi:hypothetical protein
MQGSFVMDPRRALLLPPELKAAPIESLTEQLFIERSLTENRFWLRIMKEHALFLGEGFSREIHNSSKKEIDFFIILINYYKERIPLPKPYKAFERLTRKVSKRQPLFVTLNATFSYSSSIVKSAGLTFLCWSTILHENIHHQQQSHVKEPF